ncbi:MAG: enterotoxin A family protein [Burkholderiales bacterium]
MPNTFSFEDAQKPLSAPGTFSFEEAQHPVDQGLIPSSVMSSIWGQLSDAAQAVPAEISRLGVTAGEAGRSLVGGLLNLSPHFPGDGIQELDQANIAAFRQDELDEQNNPGYQAQTTLGKVAQSVTHMAPAIGAALIAPEVAIPAFAAQGAWDAGKSAIDQGDSLANAQLKAGGQALLNSAVAEFIGGSANSLLSKIPVVGKVFVPTAVDTLGQAAARAVQGAGTMAVFKPAGTAVDYLSDNLTGEGDGKEYDWLPNAADLMTGALMAMPHAALEYAGKKSFHQEIADVINGTYLDNSDTNAQAVARLNPDSYDLNAVYPQDAGNLPMDDTAVVPALSDALVDDNRQPTVQQQADWQQRASALEQQLSQLQFAKDKSIAAAQGDAGLHSTDGIGEASNANNAAAVVNRYEPESVSAPDAGMPDVSGLPNLRSATDIAQQSLLPPVDAAKVAILAKLRDQSPNPEAQARMQAQIDQVRAAEAPRASRVVEDVDGSGADSTRALSQKILDGISPRQGDFSVVDPSTLERGNSGKASDDITRDNARIIQWLGKKLGTNVHFFRQDPRIERIDGVVNPYHKNELFVNVAAGDVGWQYVVGHEFLHQMPDDLKNAFIGSIKQDVTAENYLKARRYVNQPWLSENSQWEEIAADLMGNRFGEAQFWDRVLARIDEPSLMQKLVDYLHKFLAKLGAAGKLPFRTDRYAGNLERVRNEAVRVLQEHIARRSATEPLPETVSNDHEPHLWARKRHEIPIDANLNAEDFTTESDRPLGNHLPDVIIAHRGNVESLPVYAKKKINLTDSREEFIEPRFLNKMVESIRGIVEGEDAIIQPVITREKRQFTPHLIAAELAGQMDLERGRDIVPNAMSDSLSKTELNGLDRVFNRPMFKGKVKPGRNYFLVDEQLNDGGAFAALSLYIEEGGGHVIGALALTGREYKSRLELTDATLTDLRQRHGEIEDQFSAKTGLSFDELTEAEARILANSRPQGAVKKRITEPMPARMSTVNVATQRSILPVQGTDQEASSQVLSAPGHTIGRKRSGRPVPSTEEEARVRRTLDPAHFVFRGDARHPRVVFKFGFRTFGASTDIMVHLTTNDISDFIATSKSPNVAHEYATNFIDGGYVYMVRGQLKGIDVNKVTRKLSPYPSEREIAMPGGILPSDIMGARRVDSYGRFVGPFIKNPAFIPG